MPEIRYKIYPTLLNSYQKYLNEQDETAKNQLINRINRINDYDLETLNRFKKGSSFEDAVLKNYRHEFDHSKVLELRDMLPEKYISQKLIKFSHKNIQFYGYADVVGDHKIIDIKTTSKYKAGKYANNFQNLYLYGLRELGFTKMQYLIYDFNEIHIESYDLDTFDFEPMLVKMEKFAGFLDENRTSIKDSKIFIEPQKGGLFSI
jgi:hypothetical protein